MSKGRPREDTRTVSRHTGTGYPQLTLTWQLEEAGFSEGDDVQVDYGSGYVLITAQDADVGGLDVSPAARPNIPDVPIESAYEANTVGNRLWEIGEDYDGISQHVAEETKHLARRFHAYAKRLNGDFGDGYE